MLDSALATAKPHFARLKEFFSPVFSDNSKAFKKFSLPSSYYPFSDVN